MSPATIDQDLARALQLQQAGHTAEALKLSMATARRDPRDPRPMRLAGHLLFALGQAEQSARALGVALSLAPGSAEIEGELGACLLAMGQPEGALPHLERAARAQPENARVRAHKALALRGLRRMHEALPELERAVALAPEMAELHANLASTLEALGRNQEAADAARQALRLDPEQSLASLVLAQLAREAGEHERARATLDDLLARELPPQERAWAMMELGKVLDRLDDPTAACAALSEGQALASQLAAAQRLDRAHFPALLGRLAAHYAQPGCLAAPARSEELEASTPCPAFLLGFPRSGTTLMEQVLLAHPELRSVDEEELLGETLRAAAHTLGRPLRYPEDLPSLTVEERVALRRDYHRRLVSHLGLEDGRLPGRIVDKMPLNLPHVGFIRALFPEAPLLVMLRDPRDCVLSGFMQSFVPTVAMIHFGSLEGSAALYRSVMDCWFAARELPGVDAIELRYEELLDDLEPVARQALEALGLPWDPAVLDYRKAVPGRHISTPSRQDVARPIFTRARGRWRRYRTQLAPVLPGLEPYLEPLGYAP
jgi:tetratricopeptide (TPR) repeat protein